MTYSIAKSTFGQRIVGYTTRRSEGMGGGGGGSLGARFRDRWAPPQGITTKFRLIPGSYLNFDGDEAEYYMYVDHFIKRSNRGHVCSRQYQIIDGKLSAVGGKCLSCREIENQAEDVSWNLRHAFTGLHLTWYHLVPAEDSDGKPIIHKKGVNAGKQAMNRQICEGRKCPHCKEGHEKVFGKRVHWSLGSGHMNELAGFANEIENDCANCDGRLVVATYECEKCAHPIIDMATTDMELKAIHSYVARRRECPSCHHVGVPMKQVECDGCQDPTPTLIFDCDLEIKRQGEGTNSTVQIPRWQRTDIPDELKELAKPFAFKAVFAPDPFDVQAKLLKIKNPWGSENPRAGDHSKSYEGEEGEAGDPNFTE